MLAPRGSHRRAGHLVRISAPYLAAAVEGNGEGIVIGSETRSPSGSGFAGPGHDRIPAIVPVRYLGVRSRIQKVFTSLSDPTRIRILALLENKEHRKVEPGADRDPEPKVLGTGP